MPVVNVMQMSSYQVIDVIAVRHCFVATIFTMHMRRVVSAAFMAVRASRRVRLRHRQYMLVKMTFMRMMQMPVVQVIYMPFVLNCSVSTPRPVNMCVIFVYMMFHIYLFLTFRYFFDSCHRRRFFCRMRQRVKNQSRYMLVRQRIKDVFALSPPHQQVFTTQYPQPLRDGRQLFARCCRNLTHAGFPVR